MRAFSLIQAIPAYHLVVIFAFFITGCKKKDEQHPATPYTLNYPSGFGDPRIPSDNPMTAEGVELGRMLFYDPALSGNNQISCATCHIQKFAFSDSLAFSKGFNTTQRSSMSLANISFQSNIFWDGRAANLEEQVHFPIMNPDEMREDFFQVSLELQRNKIYPPLFKKAFGNDQITPDLIEKAIAQFERSLISKDSRLDQYLAGYKSVFTAQEERGYVLFNTHPIPELGIRGGNCGDCHGGDLLQSRNFENNGLDSVFADNGRGMFTHSIYDNGKFKVPSLRNIAVTGPYMHDGRFKTLQEVMQHYNSHLKQSPTISPLMIATNTLNSNKLDLTDQEIEDIIAFLHTLTDTTFIHNPKFSNPF